MADIKVKKGWEDRTYYGLLNGKTVKRKLKDFSPAELQSILDAADNADEYIDGVKSAKASTDNKPGEPLPAAPAVEADKKGNK